MQIRLKGRCENIKILEEFGFGLKGFFELMPNRVKNLLLVSSYYEAFTMEEDGPLLEDIDMGLSKNAELTLPKITRVSTATEALKALNRQEFDMVITMPRLIDMHAFKLNREVKKRFPNLPVYLLTQNTGDLIRMEEQNSTGTGGIEDVFVWSGNPDLFFAMIKSREDLMNIGHDIKKAGVRVILFVEDSPVYKSSILPILYKGIFKQSSAVFEDGVNDKDKLIKLRARPKIVIAQNYEEAMTLYRKYQDSLMAVISDTKFPRKGIKDESVGIHLLTKIKKENPDLPLLLLSTDHENVKKARGIPAHFLGKNSASLNNDISSFFTHHLGFGDFIFRLPNGEEVARAANLGAMKTILPKIPNDSFIYHAKNNHFSSWLMARSEVQLSLIFRSLKLEDFETVDQTKEMIVDAITELRKIRRRGVIVQFDSNDFDPDTPFIKMGKGSIGGKARGLAFMSGLLEKSVGIENQFPRIDIQVPPTVVISTSWYDDFIQFNQLSGFSRLNCTNQEVAERFLRCSLPGKLIDYLRVILKKIHEPLAIRSSSLLEDNHFDAYAGLYSTIMLPNCHPDLEQRLNQMIRAIKLVYASIFFEAPRTFAKSTVHRTEEEKMAVVIQRVFGERHGNFYYPWISGVAQSRNYYPTASMKPESGIIHIALGLGKSVVDGGEVVRFSPYTPHLTPGFGSVDEILRQNQRSFYALKLTDNPDNFIEETATLEKRLVEDALSELPVRYLSSVYSPEDHAIRDSSAMKGRRIITFNNVLKYGAFPIGEITRHFLSLAEQEFGCPVEMEFAINVSPDPKEKKHEFRLLQARPMTMHNEFQEVYLKKEEIIKSIGYSTNSLGNGIKQEFCDIIYVKPDVFDAAKTMSIAEEIKKLNDLIGKEKKKYILIGPGRWGTSDRWLGIPVKWNAISNVGTIVETSLKHFRPDPSQGSHMLHNLITLGIFYLTIGHNNEDRLDTSWFDKATRANETEHLVHIRTEAPLTIKVDGRSCRALILPPQKHRVNYSGI